MRHNWATRLSSFGNAGSLCSAAIGKICGNAKVAAVTPTSSVDIKASHSGSGEILPRLETADMKRFQLSDRMLSRIKPVHFLNAAARIRILHQQ
jgi:hypothetical protein